LAGKIYQKEELETRGPTPRLRKKRNKARSPSSFGDQKTGPGKRGQRLCQEGNPKRSSRKRIKTAPGRTEKGGRSARKRRRGKRRRTAAVTRARGGNRFSPKGWTTPSLKPWRKRRGEENMRKKKEQNASQGVVTRIESEKKNRQKQRTSTVLLQRGRKF